MSQDKPITAREAAQILKMTSHDFAQRLLDWCEELAVRPSRVLMLEEHLSADALAERIHVDRSTAYQIVNAVQPRRRLSRKLVRVPASAVASFLANKKLPPRKKAEAKQ